MKEKVRALFNIRGLGNALTPPDAKGKKLMAGNVMLSDRRVFFALCAGVTFLVLCCLNIFFQLLMNLGGIVLGEQSAFVVFLPSARLIPLYILALPVSAGLCVFLRFKIRTNFNDLNVGQKGARRFMTPEETEQRFIKIPEKTESFPGWGGAPVFRAGNRMFIDNTVVNNIIYAMTRAGKTEGLAVPTIDNVSRAGKKASMIIPDAKGTLSNTCIPHLIRRGYRVIIIDLFEFTHTHFYNPLEVIRAAYWNGDIDLAEELATDLAMIFFEDAEAKDRFWVDAPRALFTACVLAVVEDMQKENDPARVTLYTVFLLLAGLGGIKSEEKLKKGLDAFFAGRTATNPARLAYTAINFSEGKTRTSLLSITISKLDPYRRSSIAKLTSRNDLDLTEIGFGEQPVAVFLRAPFYNRSYDAIVSAFICQAFYMNMHEAAVSNNGKCARRVRVVGDEFFNFPAFPRLDNMVTVCLGAGWSFDFYAQSAAQVELKYNKNVAQVVLSNCATIYYLAATEEETRKKISELCGSVTIENVTRSGERFSLNKTITEQFEEKPLITTGELSEFRDGEMIVYPTMHRKDLDGNKVVPLPIRVRDENSLLYRYEYLPEFSPDDPIPYERLDIVPYAASSISLERLAYFPDGISAATAQNMPLLSDMMKETELNFFAGLLPPDLEIDLATVSEATFSELIWTLHKDRAIQDQPFKTMKSMIDKAKSAGPE